MNYKQSQIAKCAQIYNMELIKSAKRQASTSRSSRIFFGANYNLQNNKIHMKMLDVGLFFIA